MSVSEDSSDSSAPTGLSFKPFPPSKSAVEGAVGLEILNTEENRRRDTRFAYLYINYTAEH